jgi:hypothetical protein
MEPESQVGTGHGERYCAPDWCRTRADDPTECNDSGMVSAPRHVTEATDVLSPNRTTTIFD